MKRVVYTVVLIVACFVSFVSCKKEYHCNCVYNNMVMRVIDLGDQTSSNATKMCNQYDSSVAGEYWTCTVNTSN